VPATHEAGVALMALGYASQTGGLGVATGAGYEPVRSPGTAVQDLAVAERRPVALDVPVNFQWQDIAYEPVRVRWPDVRGPVARGEELDNAVGIIASDCIISRWAERASRCVRQKTWSAPPPRSGGARDRCSST
jgi:hypothetical protein